MSLQITPHEYNPVQLNPSFASLDKIADLDTLKKSASKKFGLVGLAITNLFWKLINACRCRKGAVKTNKTIESYTEKYKTLKGRIDKYKNGVFGNRVYPLEAEIAQDHWSPSFKAYDEHFKEFKGHLNLLELDADKKNDYRSKLNSNYQLYRVWKKELADYFDKAEKSVNEISIPVIEGLAKKSYLDTLQKFAQKKMDHLHTQKSGFESLSQESSETFNTQLDRLANLVKSKQSEIEFSCVTDHDADLKNEIEAIVQVAMNVLSTAKPKKDLPPVFLDQRKKAVAEIKKDITEEVKNIVKRLEGMIKDDVDFKDSYRAILSRIKDFGKESPDDKKDLRVWKTKLLEKIHNLAAEYEKAIGNHLEISAKINDIYQKVDPTKFEKTYNDKVKKKNPPNIVSRTYEENIKALNALYVKDPDILEIDSWIVSFETQCNEKIAEIKLCLDPDNFVKMEADYNAAIVQVESEIDSAVAAYSALDIQIEALKRKHSPQEEVSTFTAEVKSLKFDNPPLASYIEWRDTIIDEVKKKLEKKVESYIKLKLRRELSELDQQFGILAKFAVDQHEKLVMNDSSNGLDLNVGDTLKSIEEKSTVEIDSRRLSLLERNLLSHYEEAKQAVTLFLSAVEEFNNRPDPNALRNEDHAYLEAMQKQGLVATSTVDDGNCFFDSLLKYLKKNPNQAFSAEVSQSKIRRSLDVKKVRSIFYAMVDKQKENLRDTFNMILSTIIGDVKSAAQDEFDRENNLTPPILKKLKEQLREVKNDQRKFDEMSEKAKRDYTLEVYIKEMSDSKEYSGHFELVAARRLLDVPVFKHQANQAPVSMNEGDNLDNPKAMHLFLYTSKPHYEPLLKA